MTAAPGASPPPDLQVLADLHAPAIESALEEAGNERANIQTVEQQASGFGQTQVLLVLQRREGGYGQMGTVEQVTAAEARRN